MRMMYSTGFLFGGCGSPLNQNKSGLRTVRKPPKTNAEDAARAGQAALRYRPLLVLAELVFVEETSIAPIVCPVSGDVLEVRGICTGGLHVKVSGSRF